MPNVSDVHVDAILTNVSLAYRNQAFVGQRLLPVVPVKKESDKYYKYGKERFRAPDAIRAPKTAAKEIDWAVSTANYSAEEYALAQPIDDRERDNADSPLNIETDTTEVLTDNLLLGQEKRIATLVTNTANIPQNITLAGVSQWSDAVNSDPVADVTTARQTVLDATGLVPNAMVLPFKVLNKLKLHQDIIDRVKYSQLGVITLDLLKAIFEVDEILLAGAKVESAAEGQASSLSDVWGKDVVLAYVAPRPGIKTLSLGFTFQPRGFQIRRWREEKRHSDLFEASHVVDERLVAPDCAYLIKAAIA